jgi:hypothetical protein
VGHASASSTADTFSKATAPQRSVAGVHSTHASHQLTSHASRAAASTVASSL